MVGRPLAYYFGQRWAGGGTREGDQWWSDMWDAYPTFRRCQYHVTVVWAVVLVVEAGVKAIAIKVSDYDTGFLWDQILPIAAFVLAMGLTLVISRRAQLEGERRRAEATSPQPAG